LRLRILATLVVAVCPLILHGATGMSISQFDSTLTIHNVSRSGSVVVLAFGHVPDAFRPKETASAVTLSDSDGDGDVMLSAPNAEAFVVVALDVASGDSAVLAPDGGNRGNGKAFGLLARSLQVNGNQISAAGSELTLVVLRAGTGVWTWQGGASESVNIKAVADNLEPLNPDTPPIGSIARGDTIIAIRPDTLETAVVRVGGAQ